MGRLADKFIIFDRLPTLLLIFWLCILVTFTTEVSSNIATASIILPIFSVISSAIGENPLLLMIPATISCSYVFMVIINNIVVIIMIILFFLFYFSYLWLPHPMLLYFHQ